MAEKKFVRKRRKKVCVFCKQNKELDYKDVPFVRKFMSDRGKILSRRSTGCCAFHQRMVTKAIKRAREIGLVPFTVD